MKIKLTISYTITFLALRFIMHEAHEIVHTTVGRLICGCWGERDFNVWRLCGNCYDQKEISVLATFAGSIFTFIMIWYGLYLAGNTKSNNQKAFGFSLIFANIPFARILTAAMGSGDEVSGLNKLLQNHTLAWIIGLLLVIAITLLPLIRAYNLIKNKKRLAWFLLFFLTPTLLDMFIVSGVMNRLLHNGFLEEYWIMGSPMLVTLWLAFVTVIFISTIRIFTNLYSHND